MHIKSNQFENVLNLGNYIMKIINSDEKHYIIIIMNYHKVTDPSIQYPVATVLLYKYLVF